MEPQENVAPKVETREDEEQEKKLFETIELLLAAGYFRARIKGLSPFDKVVGGMVWCISTCDFDVDVDLLFQENSTIGQKIALTEKIVAVLPKMKCPHRIEPHQIQGLDFIHIFPVIQWLVKRAIETREELGDQIRAYSVSQFKKHYSLPEDDEHDAKQHKCIQAVNTLKESYKPKRMYKKPASFVDTDEETQVHSTLLEYGRRYGASKTTKSDKDSSAQKKAVSAGLVKVEETVDNESEEKRIKALMEGMSEADIQQMLSSRTVGSIVGLQSDAISEIAMEYAKRQAALQQETSELKAGKTGGTQNHKRQVAVMEKAIEEEKTKLEEEKKGLDEIVESYERSKYNLSEKTEFKEKLSIESEKLVAMETEESKSILSSLRSLVALNESLKKQEQEFKAHCKVEMQEIEEKINAVQLDNSAENNAEVERMNLINEQYDNDAEKLRKIRLLLAKKNREIASYQWKIDDVPSRQELSQYQGRFIELYNQVASTHKETKQFYTLYNTLDDTKIYLDKEVGYLNSIHDGFEQASVQSAQSKTEFLQQLEKIVHGVKQMKDKVEKRKAKEKDKRDSLNDKYMELVEKQRLYFKTVRDFQEECKKSEIIQSKLHAAGIQS